MSVTPLSALQLANYSIREGLTKLRGAVPNAMQPDLLADLRACLTGTALWLERTLPYVFASPELQAEISRYRSHLQELAQILPGLHARMLAERSRMQTMGERYEAVQAWARAHQSGV